MTSFLAHQDEDSISPRRFRRLRIVRGVVLVAAIAVVAMHHGLRATGAGALVIWELCAPLSMIFLISCDVLAYRWSLRRPTLLRSNAGLVVINAVFMLGLPILFAAAEGLRVPGASRVITVIDSCELLLIARGIRGTVRLTRRAAAMRGNPAVILVASFLLLIFVGTLLLMLPRARSPRADEGPHAGASLSVALFTATSTGCVTGLVLEPTGTYWSRFEQSIILCLFQIGGLGIMTCGVTSRSVRSSVARQDGQLSLRNRCASPLAASSC